MLHSFAINTARIGIGIPLVSALLAIGACTTPEAPSENTVAKLEAQLLKHQATIQRLQQEIQEQEKESEELGKAREKATPSLPPPLCFLEFHDTYANHYLLVEPLLSEFGYKANFAITPSMVGRTENRLTVSQIASLLQKGHEVAQHGLTHEYPGIVGEGHLLNTDASSGATVLSLSSVRGFGDPSPKIYLKARIKDDANPTGEIIEIINVDYTEKKLALGSGLTKSYTTANNAKVTLDDPECLDWIYSKSKWWFSAYFRLEKFGVILSGGQFEHLDKEGYYRDKYFYYLTDQSAKPTTLDSLYVSTDYHWPFIPKRSNPSSDLNLIIQWLSSSAHDGGVCGIYFHDIKENPDYDLGEASPDDLRTLFQAIKDLGFEVVTIPTILEYAKHFGTKIPKFLLWKDSLATGAITPLDDCNPVSAPANGCVSLTVECAYHNLANAGGKLRIRSSANGKDYDTDDLYSFDLPFTPGVTVMKTYELSPKVRFLKVLIENLSGSQVITNIKVTATLER